MIIRKIQQMSAALNSCLLLGVLSNLAAAAPQPIDTANPDNGLTDIFSTTLDGPIVPCVPGSSPSYCEFFNGDPQPTRFITITPNPTGVANLVPGGISGAASGSFLDLELNPGNTKVTIRGGTIAFQPGFALDLGGISVVTPGGIAGFVINVAPQEANVNANGVAEFRVDTEPTLAADFSTFTEIVAPPYDGTGTECTGSLCNLVELLTLDMFRYRLLIDYDPTFTSFTATFIGQTGNSSMLFATLNSVVPEPDITVTDTIAPIDDQQLPYGDVIESTSVDETVTVTNDGSADLMLGQVTQPAAPFSVLGDTCSNQTLAPASDCTMTVRFAPNATGASASSFDIPSNDPDENLVTVDVNGVSVAPEITVTDSVPPANDQQVPFGDVTANPSTPPEETVTVLNSGTADLSIGQLSQPMVPFTITNDGCSNMTWAATENCSVTVSFNPTTADPFNSSFDIPSNDVMNPTVTVDISGTGTATLLPRISVANSPVLFGDVVVGTSMDETVTVTNDGAADLTIAQITQPAAPFSVFADTCSNQALVPTANCTLMVRFGPAAAGAFADSLTIPSNDPNNATATVNTIGTGVAPEITVTDSVDPADDLLIPYGAVIESMNATETVTVANNGVVDLTLGQASIADPSGTFSILTDTCATPLNVITPGNSCTIEVDFSPATTGAFMSSLDIPSDDPSTPMSTVSLEGSGAPGPAPDISVTDPVQPVDDLQMPFGNVTEATAWDRIVTITNDGNGNLVMGQIAQTDTLENTFSILSDNCSAQIIAPAVSCEVEIRFLPTRIDTFSDSFDIPSNDPDEPSLTFSVGGSGVAVGTGTISLTPEGADSGLFGSAIRPATLLALLGLIAVNLRRRFRQEQNSLSN